MRMIRAVAIMLTLTVTITLFGCVSYVDLSDRAIVQAIGIDYLPDKKVYRISMQYFNQSSEGGQNQIDKTEDNVLKSVGEGESIFEAAKNASMLTGKDLLLSENRLIIIGKELRKYKLCDTLEFFVGNYHSHPQAYVAAAEDTAEELLDIRFKEGSTSSQRLANLIHNASVESRNKSTYPYQVMTMLCTSTESAFLPLLRTATLKTDVTIPKETGGGKGNGGGEEQSEDGEKTIILDGGVVFKGGKELCRVDDDGAMAIFFMNDTPSEYSFTVPLGQNAKPSVTLIGVTRSIKATEYNGKVKFDVSFSASGKIGSKGGIKEDDKKAAEKVAEPAEMELKRKIESSVIPIAEKGCDVFGLENTLRRCCNRFYRENKDRVGEIIAESEIEVNVNIDIFSQGIGGA